MQRMYYSQVKFLHTLSWYAFTSLSTVLFGISLCGSTYCFDIGSLLLFFARYSSNASLSYVFPAVVVTGSWNNLDVRGQSSSSRASASFVSPMHSYVLKNKNNRNGMLKITHFSDIVPTSLMASIDF